MFFVTVNGALNVKRLTTATTEPFPMKTDAGLSNQWLQLISIAIICLENVILWYFNEITIKIKDETIFSILQNFPLASIERKWFRLTLYWQRDSEQRTVSSPMMSHFEMS